jgi:hypothetical protein
MGIYLRSFTSFLDSKGVNYEVISDTNVGVAYEYEDRRYSISVHFFKDDGHVDFVSWGIGSFKGKEYQANQVCNTMNSRYPSFKFSLDKDSDVRVITSIDTSYSNAGQAIAEMTTKIVFISSFTLYDFDKIR